MTNLEIRQEQFNAAMKSYEESAAYKLLDKSVSIANITLQIFLLYRAMPLSIGAWWQIAALFAAYLLADFINGLIHMYMDKHDDYESLAGPLIAKFHLHHKTPRYEDNNVIVVYVNETGSKVWLVFYLAAVVMLTYVPGVNHVFLYVLIYVGVLSSVAEVSHYLCHNSNSTAAIFLMRIGLLLPKKRHALHHLEDNVNYSFLNGVSNPLVNFIAKRCSCGYKNGTDLHFAKYSAENKSRT
ncbi:MAG: hypothetical protein FD164_1482 [Nitrospirae bacterium]|nr:MAG: hypothetical protein FD164_1482 [Nitrospirota bacterium]